MTRFGSFRRPNKSSAPCYSPHIQRYYTKQMSTRASVKCPFEVIGGRGVFATLPGVTFRRFLGRPRSTSDSGSGSDAVWPSGDDSSRKVMSASDACSGLN